MQQNKIAFDAIIDGVERKLAVVRPSQDVREEADQVYLRAFRRARDSGAYMRVSLPKIAVDEKIWSADDEDESEALTRRLLENEKALAKGGFSATEARNLAISMRADRAALQKLRTRFNELDQITAEAKGENTRFDYLVAECTVDNTTGERIFSNYNDYMEKFREPYAQQAAWKFGALTSGLNENYRLSLPENKFLIDYGFANSAGRLINKEGKFVDVYGRLVSEDGYLVNEDGEPIDEEGNLLTETGEYRVEFQPFLDDDGNPVEPVSLTAANATTEES